MNFYFTFGSSHIFPEECRNRYVVVRAGTEAKAFRIFRSRYPDKTPNCLNCAFFYTQEEWDRCVSKWYRNEEPVVTLEEGGTAWTA